VIRTAGLQSGLRTQPHVFRIQGGIHYTVTFGFLDVIVSNTMGVVFHYQFSYNVLLRYFYFTNFLINVDTFPLVFCILICFLKLNVRNNSNV